MLLNRYQKNKKHIHFIKKVLKTYEIIKFGNLQ